MKRGETTEIFYRALQSAVGRERPVRVKLRGTLHRGHRRDPYVIEYVDCNGFAFVVLDAFEDGVDVYIPATVANDLQATVEIVADYLDGQFEEDMLRRRYEHDERVAMFRAARAFGGRFARMLLSAYVCADDYNRRRIERAFPEILKRYHDNAIQHR